MTSYLNDPCRSDRGGESEALESVAECVRLACTQAEYFADPCPSPSLSSSIAKVALDQSLLHAHARHPKFGGHRAEANEGQVRGTLIHGVMLDQLDDIVVVEGFSNWKKRAAQDARKEAIAAGKTAVLAREMSAALDAADALVENLAAEGVQLTSESEVPFAWKADTACGPIWCRSLLDHVLVDEGKIYDLKSCRSAHPRACLSHVLEYGYEIQRAAYIEALTRYRPELAGRVDFAFLFVELEPPYAVNVCRVDAVIAEYGERRWRAAQQLWGEALLKNEWRGYGRTRLEAPGWLLARMEEA